MSSTGQPRTFSDLYTQLREAIRVHSSTGLDNIAKRYINMAHIDIYLGAHERMPWVERRATLITQPSYSTGTLSVVKGGTTLTGSGTAWNTSNDFGVANMRAGGKIVIEGGIEIYEISAVSGDTSATLTSRFVQDDASDVTYVYFEDEYALASDFLRPLNFNFFDLNRQFRLRERNQFRAENVRSAIPGKPRECTLIELAPSGNTTRRQRLAFNKPTDVAYSIPYVYVTSNIVVSATGTAQEEFTADTDEPLLPLGFRQCILEKALYWYWRDRKDDSRAQAANAAFADVWLRIANAQDLAQSRPRLAAQIGSYFSRARRPMSGGSSPGVTSGSAFDELRE